MTESVKRLEKKLCSFEKVKRLPRKLSDALMKTNSEQKQVVGRNFGKLVKRFPTFFCWYGDVYQQRYSEVVFEMHI